MEEDEGIEGVTVETLLEFLAQNRDIHELDERTEVNVRMLSRECKLTLKKASRQLERWVEAGILEECTNKRYCPITGKATQAWRRVSLPEDNNK